MTCLLICFVTLIFIISLCHATPSELNAVVVVFRHGDRTPVRPYPTDPYKNRSFWPADWGMLTNIGKRQHYELGQFLRRRYFGFLPEKYSEKDTYVRSTDVDRTLMSAEAILAGLYPPVQSDVWDKSLEWQPIAVHTVPEKLDNVLAGKKPCKKYDDLLQELFDTEYFRNVSRLNRDLYRYLTRFSGETINDLESLEHLYNTFQIETWYNYTIPDWARKVFPQKMQPWAFLSFATSTFTTDLARLKIGPFFNEIIRYFRNRTETPNDSKYYAPKFLMFSAHDTTIANILNSMGAFEYHCPPYAATIIFELRKAFDGSNFVNLFYKNTSEVRALIPFNCEPDCNLTDFERLSGPIVLAPEQWESQCHGAVWSFKENPFNFYLVLIGVGFALLCVVLVLFLASYRGTRKDGNVYSQLPNEEYT